MQFDLKIATRTETGKGAARSLRRQGRIPAVLYGPHTTVALTMDPEQVSKILHSQSGSNALLNLQLTGESGETRRTAMLRDYQVDPVTGAILHADLFEVAMDKPVRVRVPVSVTGSTPIGVAEGGVLHHNMRELHIECLPGQIPDSFAVDPSRLKINQGIHVKEVPVVSGIKILDDPDMMVISVVAPISEAKLEALLTTTPTGEAAAEPEVIGKKPEEGEEVPEVEGEAKPGAKAETKPGAKVEAKPGAKAEAKPGAKAPGAPAAESKEEKKEGKEVKGEKKK